MAQVLAKPFSSSEAGHRSACSSPAAYALEVFVDSVVAEEPLALRCVRGEHAKLGLFDGFDIDKKRRWDLLTEGATPFDWIRVVQVGYAVQRLAPRRSGGVGDRGVEGRRTSHPGGLLVIEHVVPRTVRENDVRTDFSEDAAGGRETLAFVDDLQIAPFEAVILPVENSRRTLSLLPTDRRDLRGRKVGRAAVAGGHRRDGDSPATFAQACQSPSAEDLGVVGVGHEDEDGSSVIGLHGRPLSRQATAKINFATVACSPSSGRDGALGASLAAV